jgi:hypothetical protein
MISVPTPQLTDEQKAQQAADAEKNEQASQALSEETSKLKAEMDDIRQSAAALKHGGSKDDYNALADKLQQLQSDATAANARFSAAGIPDSQYSAKAIRNVQDYAETAQHSARGAGAASGDNEDVRAVHHGNVQNDLDSIDSQMQGTS